MVTAVITVYLFPNHGKFRYEYQKGAPWKHEDLMAPFDIAIRKTADELKQERDSLLVNYKPYFKIIETTSQTKLSEFNTAYKDLYKAAEEQVKKSQGVATVPDSLHDYIFSYANNLLGFIYEKGVVDFNEAKIYIKKGTSLVIMKDRVAETRDFSEVFTQKLAYNYINKALARDFDNNTLIAALVKQLKIYDFIDRNLVYDEATSNKVKQEMVNSISLTKGMVQAGERVIFKGDVVRDDNYRILESLRMEYESILGSGSNFVWLILGRVMIVIIAFIVFFLFLLNFRREVLESKTKTLFMLLMVLMMIVPVALISRFSMLSIYLVPLVALPIILQTFFDSRIALFIHSIVIMVTGIFAPNGYEFLFLHFMAGAVAIFSLSQLRKRGHLFYAVAMVFLAYSLTYTAFALIQEGDYAKINYVAYGWFAINCLLLLASYPLIFIFEKSFGFLSEMTLLELSDTNHPALRHLAEKAPGTFQHVMQVANLAEEAVRKIGGDPLLMRVGALYHDIGKTGAPVFFVENQAGTRSPHEGLSNTKSAQMIVQHVVHGMELAKKYKLPKQVSDFIITHHGTGLVKYFYTQEANAIGEENANIADFSYPGPAPFSKETAVLMMADAVEAASRTLKEYSEDSIQKLVDKIVTTQMEDNQYAEADITFRDITQVKEVLVEKLMNIYHARIEYPELKK
jgi:putative nucleotidyltransferase with HDIG domain